MKPISVIILASANMQDLAATESSIASLAAEIIIISLYDKLPLAQYKVIVCRNNITEALVQAEQHCTNEWILYLYAGEVVADSLAAQLQYLFTTHCVEKYQAFSLPVISLPSNSYTPMSSFLYPQICSARLYNKKQNSFKLLREPVSLYDSSLLDNVIKTQDIFLLESNIYQYCFTDSSNLLRHFDLYTDLYAKELQLHGYKSLTGFGLIKSMLNMVYMFLGRRFFSWGIKGGVYSILTALQKLVACYKLSSFNNAATSLYSKNS